MTTIFAAGENRMWQ